MIEAIQHEGQMISADMVRLLRQIDSATFRDEQESFVRAQRDSIVKRMAALVKKLESSNHDVRTAGVVTRFRAVLEAMESETPSLDHEARSGWAAFREAVQPSYEALAAGLRSLSVPAASVRPSNYKRNIFHVMCGILVWLATLFLPSRGWMIGVAGAFVLAAWSMEISRRYSETINRALMWFFGPVAHPHEQHSVNSATWYVTALLLISLLFPPQACGVAVIVLGVGDPVAAIVGRRYGRIRLVDGRSLEGTIAFFLSAAVVATVTLLVSTSLSMAILLAAVGAAVGCLVELFSGKVDDNLTIPVTVAGAVAAVSAMLG